MGNRGPPVDKSNNDDDDDDDDDDMISKPFRVTRRCLCGKFFFFFGGPAAADVPNDSTPGSPAELWFVTFINSILWITVPATSWCGWRLRSAWFSYPRYNHGTHASRLRN